MIPQVPDVISFTKNLQNAAALDCTITNTAKPLVLIPIFPNFPGPGNSISYQNAGSDNPGVAIIWGFHAGQGTLQLYNESQPICEGTPVGIKNPRLLGVAYPTGQGNGEIVFFIPQIAAGLTIGFQAVSLNHCIVSGIMPQVIGVGPY